MLYKLKNKSAMFMVFSYMGISISMASTITKEECVAKVEQELEQDEARCVQKYPVPEDENHIDCLKGAWEVYHTRLGACDNLNSSVW